MALPELSELISLLFGPEPPAAWTGAALHWVAADRLTLCLYGQEADQAAGFYWAGSATELAGPRFDTAWGTEDRPGGTVSAERQPGAEPFTEAESAFLRQFALVAEAAAALRRARAESEAARQQADAAQRSKITFLSSLSHELKTPLNGILGFSTLLENSALDPSQRSMVQTIGESGQRLLSTIDNILELAQFESGQFQLEAAPFSPRAVLEAVSTKHAPAAAEKGLAWEVRVNDSLPPVLEGDPVRLGQAWGHLLSNAVKFTRQGAVLVVLESRSLSEGQLELTLVVEDTGIGYRGPRDGAGFQPFHQEDGSLTRRFGGTGLGLTLCDRLVRAMDGGLSLWGEPGVGTKVRAWTRLNTHREGGPR